MALATLPVCLLAGEFYAMGSFLWTASFALVLGQLLFRLCSRPEETPLRYAMIIAAVGWLSVSLIGAMPFLTLALYLSTLSEATETVRQFQNPLNALFESLSGFTSTGLSMALNPGDLPYSLQWWRSLSEWIGGVGVIVLMLSVIQSAPGIYRLYYSEARNDKLFPSVTSTVRTIWWIYLLYTTLSVLLLRVAGMPWWDALNHGMTGIATGGFSINAGSIGVYDRTVQLAMLPVMLLGSISFMMHFQLITRRSLLPLWKDTQHRLLIAILVIGAVLLLLENMWFAAPISWVDTLFQWVSAFTTCGFSTDNVQVWSPTAILILTLAMIMGGAAGSTVGGLKLNRVLLLIKGLQWRVEQLRLRPHQMMRYEMNGSVISEKEAYERVESATVVVFLWGMALLLALVALLHVVPPDYSTGSVMFEVASALSNVGLSVGITGPNMHWVGKVTLMICMWIGRLEIIPIALLISMMLGFERR
jgi:trk system potassium uptake protein TrkH